MIAKTLGDRSSHLTRDSIARSNFHLMRNHQTFCLLTPPFLALSIFLSIALKTP